MKVTAGERAIHISASYQDARLVLAVMENHKRSQRRPLAPLIELLRDAILRGTAKGYPKQSGAKEDGG